MVIKSKIKFCCFFIKLKFTVPKLRKEIRFINLGISTGFLS